MLVGSEARGRFLSHAGNEPMNRATLLTAAGSGAIAVIRIAGEGVHPFLAECFDRKIIADRCIHGRIKADGQEIDDAVVVLTGSGQADLNVHGSSWVVRKILDLLNRRGFTVVGWTSEQSWAMDGENELQREIHGALASARTELGVRVLLNQERAWRELIAAKPGSDELLHVLSDPTLEYLLNPPSVAIVGLPNVGKSTLANQLFGQDRSITADFPGTTRDWVGELANIDGLVVKLLDTPGMRETNEEIEQRAIQKSAPVIASADLIVIVIDPTQDRGEQLALANRWPDALRVINKSDLADWNDGGLRIVATSGTGVDQLRRKILQHFGLLDLNEQAPRCWTDRQRAVVRAGEPARIIGGRMAR